MKTLILTLAAFATFFSIQASANQKSYVNALSAYYTTFKADSPENCINGLINSQLDAARFIKFAIRLNGQKFWILDKYAFTGRSLNNDIYKGTIGARVEEHKISSYETYYTCRIQESVVDYYDSETKSYQYVVMEIRNDINQVLFKTKMMH